MKNILFYFCVVLNIIVIIYILNTKEEKKFISVEIKGAVKNPGVYKLEEKSIVKDQTTTNMIQRISHLFAINLLISKEI